MIQPVVLSKLERLLQKGIQTEAEVVYFLASVRKLIEVDYAQDDFELLKFHCDWVLHSQLSGRVAKQVMTWFDDLQEDINNGGVAPHDHLISIDALIGAHGFQSDLRRFLSKVQLSAHITEGVVWPTFLRLYMRVIEDCPLMLAKRSRPSGLPVPEAPRYIRQIVVRPVAPSENNANSLVLEWAVHLRDDIAIQKAVTTFRFEFFNAFLEKQSS